MEVKRKERSFSESVIRVSVDVMESEMRSWVLEGDVSEGLPSDDPSHLAPMVSAFGGVCL